MLEFEVWLDTQAKGEWSHSLRAHFRRQDDAIAYAEQQAKLRIDFEEPIRLRVIGPSGQDQSLLPELFLLQQPHDQGVKPMTYASHPSIPSTRPA